MNKYDIIYKQNTFDSVKRIYETFYKTNDRQEQLKLYKLACLIAKIK